MTLDLKKPKMAEADGGNEFEYVTIINPYMMGWREDGKVNCQISKAVIAPLHQMIALPF